MVKGVGGGMRGSIVGGCMGGGGAVAEAVVDPEVSLH